MPGKGHIPSLDERIVRTLKANTTRTVGGLARDASPGMTRDRVASTRRGGVGLPATARLSHIDKFLIENDTDDSFTLDFTPVRGSWNVTCSWDLVDDDYDAGIPGDYSITGRTVTILDPAVAFIGASPTYPKVLQVEYDYLAGVPVAPTLDTAPTSVRDTRTTSANGTAHDYVLPAGAQAGDLLIVALHSFADLTSVPAGWTLLESVPFDGGRQLNVLWGVSDGSGTEVFHATWSGAGVSIKHVFSIAVVGATVAASDSVPGATVSTLTTAAVAAGGWTMHVVASDDGWTFDTLTADIAPGSGDPSMGFAHESPGSGTGTGVTSDGGTRDFASVTIKLSGV